MITESIRTILGTELSEKVEAAMKGKGKEGKDVDLVVGNDGTFVPAEKFDALKTQSGSAESALKAAADALKAVGGSGDPTKIADDVKTAQSTMTTLQNDYKTKIKQIQKNTALKMALAGQVHDPADIISLMDLEKIEVDESGNLKTDLESVLKPIKESKSYLFKTQDQNQDIKGAKPAQPGAETKPEAQGGPVIF